MITAVKPYYTLLPFSPGKGHYREEESIMTNKQNNSKVYPVRVLREELRQRSVQEAAALPACATASSWRRTVSSS